MSDPARQRREWDEIGTMDALWAILSDPAKRHGRWDIEEFLATGQMEIDEFLGAAAHWHLPRKRRRSLDFGCGVGRLTRALAGHFDAATGVDISEVMVSQARILNAGVNRASFEVLGPTGLEAYSDRSFDCIYSRIVLQHITDRAETGRILLDFVRLLAVGGILSFQLPAAIPIRRRLQPRPRLYSMLRSLHIPEEFLYQRLGLHPIRMRSVSESDVVSLLTAAGGSVLKVDRVAHPTGVDDRTYWITRSA